MGEPMVTAWSFSKQIVKTASRGHSNTRQTSKGPLFFKEATPTVRGATPKAESHFWLINTCQTVAIVEATEIGLKCWLQNQTTSRTGKRTEFRGRPVPSTPDITTQQQEKVPPMFKKTLISLAVASSLGLTGCFDSGSDNKNANPSPKYTDESINGTWLVFNPATRQIPTPTDLSFSGSKDGTFKI